jgi:Domain of unknown function (DUF4388)
MALIGELSDLSLGELIEFFCNQRKTGCLKVVYPVGPGLFYLKSGSVVHAQIGELRGIEAVYFALTQPNASFTFTASAEPPQQTINQPWTSVVLEGLRRMDQGVPAPNPFPSGSPQNQIEKKPVVALAAVAPPKVEKNPVVEVASVAPPKVEKNPVVEVAAVAPPKVEKNPVVEVAAAAPPKVEKNPVVEVAAVAPPKEVTRPRVSVAAAANVPEVPTFGVLSSQSEISKFQSRRWSTPAIVGAIILLIAVVGVPWGWYARSKARQPVTVPEKVVENPPVTPTLSTAESSASPEVTETNSTSTSPAEDPQAAKHLAEARTKERARMLEQSQAANSHSETAAKPAKAQNNGSKNVTVTVTYDENGRVTGASGGDATALRIARQKRFPAGKPGSATVTIPIN